MRSALKPTFETKLLGKGYDFVIGIDEAGRGPWAGPVSIAAYIFQPALHTIDGIQDSKKISKKKRQEIFSKLINTPENILHVFQKPETIDKLGIGKAIEKSIDDIVKKIALKYPKTRNFFLIDGYFKSNFDCEYELVKKGDSKFYSIAAASIIAKVKRDRIMYEFAKKYPQYGFDKHVGYGTKFHRIALNKHGPCPIHRMSFRPIKRED